MIRTAIYARFSTTMQSERSIEDQARLCIERAGREGWTITETYSDMAISGASMHRPGLQSLVTAAEKGQIDIVLAEALDRISRDQADIATLFKRLTFYGVRVVTLAEGEINELHVGLKGTMNQLFLKDLAAKTHRGLRGRVEAGRSGGGNAYGYNVVRVVNEAGEPERGERAINPEESGIVRRIFEEFASGKSPKAIAHGLNDDHIAGPRGKLWRDSAIRGHRQRGTGILNNELYIGRLVWNRLRYVKDPETGKRVSRINAREEWIITDVPQLRIIDSDLWDKVKARQEDIDATPAVQGIKASRFWEKRRKKHLLTGLLTCGACGGGFASIGRDYVACSNARKLRTCKENRSFKREVLEDAILDLLKDRLMVPEAVAAFIDAVTRGTNQVRAGQDKARRGVERDLERVTNKLSGLYEAIADGLRTPGLLAQLEDLEAHKSDLQSKLASPPPAPVRLHPNLSALYKRKVEDLTASLADPSIREQALDTIRGLIAQVVVHHDDENIVLELEGALTAMLDAAQAGAGTGIDVCSVKVVAGVGFEPTTFRL